MKRRLGLFVSILTAGAWLTESVAQTTLSEEAWGEDSAGREISRFTLTNEHGARASLMALGAAVLSLEAPDRDGVFRDVVLGFDTARDYATDNSPYFGLTIGRYAGRIAGTSLTLDGQTYELASSPGPGGAPARMVLHGGPDGFSNRLWDAARVETENGPAVRFTLESPDGDQGYPGEMTVSVSYQWTDDYRLIADYEATTTKPTVINLTQHSYFNLAGAGSGDILDHLLTIKADFFTFATPDNLPTGEILSVRGTPFDFTEAKLIGRDIESVDPQMRQNRGYNQNFVLRPAGIPGQLTEAATLEDQESGRVLTVFTSEPGLFLYTANFLDTERVMKGGQKYPLRAGVALETGHFPDSPNQPHFPTTTLMPGDSFRSRTVFAFSVR